MSPPGVYGRPRSALSDEQKSDLKEKWGKKGPLYGSANRIELIAWDIAVHFEALAEHRSSPICERYESSFRFARACGVGVSR